jgi:hypothetical protein
MKGFLETHKLYSWGAMFLDRPFLKTPVAPLPIYSCPLTARVAFETRLSDYQPTQSGQYRPRIHDTTRVNGYVSELIIILPHRRVIVEDN